MDEPLNPKPSEDSGSPGTNGTCVVCGRDLHGTSYRGHCPGCGSDAAKSLPSPPLIPGAAPAGAFCVRCGHDVQSFPRDGFCPWCRTRISDSLPGPVEPGQVVRDDRPCLVCGYSLQGLASGSNCPECGTPIERSLRGPLLRYSSPEYLQKLHRGIVYAEVGTALKLAASVGFFFIRYAAIGLGQQMLVEILGGLIAVIMLVGWWMFTTPDPGAGGSEPGVGARRWTRAMVVVMGGLEVFLAAFSFLPVVSTTAVAAAGGGGFGGQLIFMSVRSLLEWGVGAGGMIALGCYLRALSGRVPDRTLLQRATLYRWLIPLLLGVGAVPWFFCCGVPLLPRLGGIVLFFVMIEPWRWKLKAIRKAVAHESLAAAPPVG